MDLKEKIVSSYVAFEDGVNMNSDVHEIRSKAFQNFEKLGFPSKKIEAWKYTSLNAVLREDYCLFPNKKKTVTLPQVKDHFIHDIDTYKVVFVDGKYSSFLSETTHDNFDVCLMSSALAKPKYKPIIENYFNKVAKQDHLTSLNTAFVKEGAYIHIPRNTEVEKPIQIINFTTGTEDAIMTQPRNLIVVEQNAYVQIIERHQSLTQNAALTNVVTEIFADRYATVDYYKIQNDHTSASLVDNTFIEQQSESTVAVHTFSFGGKVTRNNLNFYQMGKHINSTLKGITIIEGKQHVDHHTLVHHTAPNCESHQDYKGIFNERAVGVFNGKVVVEKDAQKTNAYQQNNNVLVSDRSTINAKPQLEIFADDVKCSHGCTTGQLDEQALFYMQQRGIPKKEARALLMYAFANTVLESVKIPEVKERITKLIAMKLSVRIGFDL
ncbi:MAG: Fe-S cluster assembly protein SufD [Flavobacteriaceae bacterium]|nr:Fe-S cluster assembly protein SufD [Flavobacteriaceae bacterium]